MKLLSLICAALFSVSVMASHEWSHSTGLNFLSNTGNSQVTTLGATHTSATRLGSMHDWSFDIFGNYNYGEDGNLSPSKNLNNWGAGFKLGKFLNPKTEVYLQERFQGNEFENYDFRWGNELGLIYNFFGKAAGSAKAGDMTSGGGDGSTGANTKPGLTYGNHFLYIKGAYQYAYEDYVVLPIDPDYKKTRHNSVVGLGYGTNLSSNLAFVAKADWIKTLDGDGRSIIEGSAGIKSQLSKLFGLTAEYTFSFNDKLEDVGLENYSSAYIVSLTANY